MGKKTEQILLGHGSGGGLMHDLVEGLFVKHFSNPYLDLQSDAAIFQALPGKTAFSTDSFVVNPVFFPGGNIGKLAVCGTVNDLVAAGSTPRFLSAGFIIEEGLPLEKLETIVSSMSDEANTAGVIIVAGDTKVVEKGKCDHLFINTSGLGFIPHEQEYQGSWELVQAGDQVIITGCIAEHGMAVMAARNKLEEGIGFLSDCASLHWIIPLVLKDPGGVRLMRDPTRGGIATILCELAESTGFGIRVFEDRIPIRPDVAGFCDLLGFDPLYVANEGKMIIIAAPEKAAGIVRRLRSHPLGKEAATIGEVSRDHPGRFRLKTRIGGTRLVHMLRGDQLPRIC
ncbi:MAG: hydrogenase expression/formation protein HypE [Bacteroidales bacterium]